MTIRIGMMVCLLIGVAAGQVTYYVDAGAGDDGNDGRSSGSAWKSLEKVNQQTFGPGDRILFKRGSRYAGQLAPKGSGEEGRLIVIGVYGEGDRPRIDGEGVDSALVLHNVEYWEVSGLEITNTGKTRGPRSGVRIRVDDFGTARHIRIRDLYIHDVNGTNVKADGGGSGIAWSNGGERVKSRFDGLVIENCRLVRTDRNGIVGGGYGDRREWHPSLNVVIRGNVIEDFGGDGIVPIGTDGCLIERNVLRDGRQRAKDAACGIWPFASDNTVIQFNEVSGMRLDGGHDGQGFDSVYNCRNTIIQYNYSHDNEGGFFMACNWAKPGDPSSAGNVGTIVRYNISQNDGDPNGKTEGNPIMFVGPVRDVRFYNNVIYVSKRMNGRPMINTWVTELGPPEDVRFYNNVFYAEPETSLGWVIGGIRKLAFENNVFFGTRFGPPAGVDGITADPLFVAPGSGKDGLGSLGGYRLGEGSPCLRAGRVVENNGGRDFWGNPVPSDRAPDIGAHQR